MTVTVPTAGRLVTIGIIATCGLFEPRSAAAMTYSVSVYSSGTVSGATLYLYGNIVDNSVLGGATHSGYTTYAHIVTPTGRRADMGGSGFAATATLSVASVSRAEIGTWSAYITGNLNCSLLPGSPVGYGGSGPSIGEVIDNYKRIIVYASYAVYYRCHPGSCFSANVVNSQGHYPPFKQLSFLTVGPVCFSVGIEKEVPSCEAPIVDH